MLKLWIIYNLEVVVIHMNNETVTWNLSRLFNEINFICECIIISIIIGHYFNYYHYNEN